jgi:hypothetical protein
VAIIECTAADNPGDPQYTANHSGNGILLADTDRGLIERYVANGNGAAKAGRSGGPVGIWTYASNRGGEVGATHGEVGATHSSL